MIDSSQSEIHNVSLPSTLTLLCWFAFLVASVTDSQVKEYNDELPLRLLQRRRRAPDVRTLPWRRVLQQELPAERVEAAPPWLWTQVGRTPREERALLAKSLPKAHLISMLSLCRPMPTRLIHAVSFVLCV